MKFSDFPTLNLGSLDVKPTISGSGSQQWKHVIACDSCDSCCPKMHQLACGHAFCDRCAAVKLIRRPDNQNVSCDVCRKPTVPTMVTIEEHLIAQLGCVCPFCAHELTISTLREHFTHCTVTAGQKNNNDNGQPNPSEESNSNSKNIVLPNNRKEQQINNRKNKKNRREARRAMMKYPPDLGDGSCEALVLELCPPTEGAPCPSTSFANHPETENEPEQLPASSDCPEDHSKAFVPEARLDLIEDSVKKLMHYVYPTYPIVYTFSLHRGSRRDDGRKLFCSHPAIIEGFGFYLEATEYVLRLIFSYGDNQRLRSWPASWMITVRDEDDAKGTVRSRCVENAQVGLCVEFGSFLIDHKRRNTVITVCFDKVKKGDS